jgi:hypothetical protein
VGNAACFFISPRFEGMEQASKWRGDRKLGVLIDCVLMARHRVGRLRRDSFDVEYFGSGTLGL